MNTHLENLVHRLDHPARRPPISPVLARLLVDPLNQRTIDRTLRVNGWPTQNIEDGRQDVNAQAVAALQRGHSPDTLDQMTAFCAKIARDHAIKVKQRAAKREQDFLGPCNPDEYCPLEYGAARRDPVDAGRQLEALAQLFREGKMPEHGVDILEGVACRISHTKIANDLRISADSVKARMRQMRKVYRRRMVELKMWPGMDLLKLVSSTPHAAAMLREAA
jgi:DNA-directed RNA polymerase specialized sigma24 family protein